MSREITIFDKFRWFRDRHYKAFNKKALKWLWQRWTRGFDDTDLWGLNITISKHVLPMLKAFKNLPPAGSPCFEPMEIWDKDTEENLKARENNYDKWLSMLDDMIYFHECIIKELDVPWDYHKELTPEQRVSWQKHYEEFKECYIDNSQKYRRGEEAFFRYYRALWD